MQNHSEIAEFPWKIADLIKDDCEEKGLSPIYETLLRKRLLFKVTQCFAEADLSPATVDNHGMGTIFKYLIRKFKEASNEAARKDSLRDV